MNIMMTHIKSSVGVLAIGQSNPCKPFVATRDTKENNLKLESVYSTKTNTNMKKDDKIVHNRKVYVGRPLQRRWAHRWRKSHP